MQQCLSNSLKQNKSETTNLNSFDVIKQSFNIHIPNAKVVIGYVEWK